MEEEREIGPDEDRWDTYEMRGNEKERKKSPEACKTESDKETT